MMDLVNVFMIVFDAFHYSHNLSKNLIYLINIALCRMNKLWYAIVILG